MVQPSLVLVMEDAALASMLLADVLLEDGYRVASPFGRWSEGLRWLQGHRPDLAILDVLLVDGPVYTLADELRRRGIPSLFNSG